MRKIGPVEVSLFQRRDATDRQIDRLVYELNGLTEGEITVVEGVGKRGKIHL